MKLKKQLAGAALSATLMFGIWGNLINWLYSSSEESTTTTQSVQDNEQDWGWPFPNN
jgi:hypothetical protein